MTNLATASSVGYLSFDVPSITVVLLAIASLDVSVGWMWSSLAYLVDTPTDVIPSFNGTSVAPSIWT